MKKWCTVLVGFGKIAEGYSRDPVMARHFPYATHAQVLRDHPLLDWQAVVDPAPAARFIAKRKWKKKVVVSTPAELGDLRENVTLLVLATPPDQRQGILGEFPALRGVMLEKPLGIDLASSRAFLEECERRGIYVQVNLWRRGDKVLRELAKVKLRRFIGRLQAAFGIYGNGLSNNGIHMVDLVRMLVGPISSVQRLPGLSFREGPLSNNENFPFSLVVKGGTPVSFIPVRFSNYRENGLSLWGDRGRLDIWNEGLTVQKFGVCKHRGLFKAKEVAHDRPVYLPSQSGYALYRLYSNLVSVLEGKGQLWSSGFSAMKTIQVLDAIQRTASPQRSYPDEI